jgi:hypothetical protein
MAAFTGGYGKVAFSFGGMVPDFEELLPGKYSEVPTAVHNRYSLEPSGATLGEIAEDNGIW